MKNLYGVFYKSKGKWIGPYDGELYEKDSLEIGGNIDYFRELKTKLKSSLQIRKLKWKKTRIEI